MHYISEELEAGIRVALPAGTTVVHVMEGSRTLATLDQGALELIKSALINLKAYTAAGGDFPDVNEETTISEMMLYIGISPSDKPDA